MAHLGGPQVTWIRKIRNRTKFWSEIVRGINLLEDLGIDGRIILKLVLKK
jgi:hypothetical protein